MEMSKYKNLYPKEYFEKYACICLNDVLKLTLILREKRYGEDRPDLISSDEKIGVEVTQAITTEEGVENKLFQQEYPEENKIECIKKEAKRLNIENRIKYHNNYITITENSSTEYIKNKIIDRINSKNKKLNNDTFHKYESNRLCLIIETFNNYIIQAIDEYYKQNNLNYKFFYETIYVINGDNLLIFEHGKLINEIKIRFYIEDAQK